MGNSPTKAVLAPVDSPVNMAETPDISDTKAKINSMLPDSPVPMAALDGLRESDKIISLVPMKIDNRGEHDLVYDFTIEFETKALALRYEDNEWNVIAEGEEVEAVGYALQEYHHEHGM